MNRLNKIILSFVLSFFCLLMSVSNANLVANESYSLSTGSRTSENLSSLNGYTTQQCGTILRNYLSDTTNETYKTEFETFKNTFMVNYDSYFVNINTGSSGSYYNIYFFNKADFSMCYVANDSVNFRLFANNGNYLQIRTHQNASSNSLSKIYRYSIDTAGIQNYVGIEYVPYFETNANIYNIVVSSESFYWDGTYYYKAESDEPDTPTMPTNTEIASAVQMFYNSDLYKNNTNFKDFMVVYSFVTGYYSFIGTDNHLLQEIYYDGAKPSNDDFTYPETWWRIYNYLGNIQNLFYGSNYWLYSTVKVDDVLSPIKYDGVGKLNDLFNLKFTTQSIIVYSSYEYEVYEYWPPEIEGDSNKKETTTIPGDQYTYDETLDPTDSEYSPIQNYIPVNPSQTIISDVDVSEINKTFEENKGILNIENASWLFTANNKLIGYFIGFLSLLIVFLIISRALGG